MLSPEAMQTSLCFRIGHVYFRPFMYGGTVDCVELLLYFLHDLWAELMEQREAFQSVSQEVHREQRCGAGSFAMQYSRKHPNAAPDEVVSYVVSQWRVIDKRMGLLIPYAEIRQSFAHMKGIAGRFPDEI